MSKQFTFLIIPDDESETKSFTLNKIFLKTFVFFFFLALVGTICMSIIFIPKVLEHEELNTKYEVLIKDRIKILELTESLEKLIHMDEFVRNSLGVEFNFSETPEIIDSVLMVIPDNNIISILDNIPSVAPIEGYVSKRMESIFSNIDKAHDGIDIVAKEGTPIRAAASGVVVFSGWTYEMGNLIIIYHGSDYITHYGHNQKNIVSKLDIVDKGDIIGFVGNTGISSGPHLHFEVWKGEISIDPMIYFPRYLKKDLTLKKNDG